MNNINNIIKTVIDQFKDNIGASVLLLVSLAWNDVVQTAISQYFPLDNDTIYAKLVYAIVITFIVILLQSTLIKNWKDDDEEEGCGCM
jgi:hypothetical protein